MDYLQHFNDNSQQYLHYRPDYPEALFQYLVGLVEERKLAWDVGTGNGQSALVLANYFDEVIGTDINQAQLDVATRKNNIRYYCWPAGRTEIQSGGVNMITVAQALHWFNFENFYTEVRRVASSECVIAAWCYSLAKISPDIDKLIMQLYSEILGDLYWPPQRKYIDSHYLTIPFPFRRVVPPGFKIIKKYNVKEFISFLCTWSAVKEYKKQKATDPIQLISAELKAAWGDPDDKKIVTWPIHMLVGYVD